jgi:transposase
MRKIREVLRLKWGCGLANLAVARSCHISSSTVSEYVKRAKASGFCWPLPDDLDDAALYARLYPPAERPADQAIPMPDWAEVHKEMGRKGVTRQLLWQEYRAQHPTGYGYSQFCEHYRRWAAKLHPRMRQTHAAGEGYVDYSGLKMSVVDVATGEVCEVEIFVYVLAASDYIYAEAQWGQDAASWLGGHVRTFEHLGGVPPVTVPDNLKSGVKQPCRYEPDVNRAYQALAEHYGTAVVPARVRKPRDKAKVETAVQIVQREVQAPLRDVHFLGLVALNAAIAERLRRINDRPMRHVGQSRRELLEAVDRPALLPLPVRPFELADWKLAKVAIDYHVEFDDHFYSVPYRLIGQRVEVRATSGVVEVYHQGQRVASHLRSRLRGAHTTDPAHMPESHRSIAAWTPERFLAWAAKTGPETRALVEALLTGRRHPQQAFRSCLGVLSLERRYGAERLEAACRRARHFGLASYRGVKNILERGLDGAPIEAPLETSTEAHVRGASYYA